MTARSLQQQINQAPLSGMQWLLWWMATAGKGLEGLIVFSGGIALPLIAAEFGLGPLQRGLVVASSLLGILLGASLFGGLADRIGRKPVFIAELLLLLAGLLLTACSSSTAQLWSGLLLVGLALGADYPTAHLLIAESIPVPIRGRLVLSAFGFQAVGAVAGTLLASVLLAAHPQPDAWRLLYLLPVLPLALVLLGRLLLPESCLWLASRGERQRAELQLARLLGRTDLQVDWSAAADEQPSGETTSAEPPGWPALFDQRYRRATTLAAVPWFLQDLATYGIGIFAPLILAGALGANPALPPSAGAPSAGSLAADLVAARGTALINGALLIGIALAAALADRWGRIPLQILGFVGCAAGLCLAALAVPAGAAPAPVPLLMAGLLLFQLMTNLGPNAQTYLLAGELFPTELRGLGAGFAASAGKLGAVLIALLYPLLEADWGVRALLLLLAATSLLGALVTWCFRIETSGSDLQQI